MLDRLLSAPSGRLSMRRALFALSVLASIGCAVGSLILSRDIGAGAVSVLASTTAATAAAAGLGRFAEKAGE